MRQKIYLFILIFLLLFSINYAEDSTHTFLNGVVFDTTAEDSTSVSFDLTAWTYKNITFLNEVVVVGAPTSLTLTLRGSLDDTTYYDLKNSVVPFNSSIVYGTVSVNEWFVLRDIYPKPNYLKMHAESVGCTTGVTYTFTTKGMFQR